MSTSVIFNEVELKNEHITFIDDRKWSRCKTGFPLGTNQGQANIYSVKYMSEDEWILDPVTIADVYEPLVCFFFLLLHQKPCLL